MNLIREPKAMFKDIFNPGISGNERIEEIMNIIPIPEIDTKVGKPIELKGRTIYPVIQTYVTQAQDFAMIEMFPIALVVLEQDNEYVIPLMEDEIDPEKLIKMVSSKKSLKKQKL
ncbi:MAG: hypothetical protein ACXVHT_08710 [Methanobacterium sp.]